MQKDTRTRKRERGERRKNEERENKKMRKKRRGPGKFGHLQSHGDGIRQNDGTERERVRANGSEQQARDLRGVVNCEYIARRPKAEKEMRLQRKEHGRKKEGIPHRRMSHGTTRGHVVGRGASGSGQNEADASEKDTRMYNKHTHTNKKYIQDTTRTYLRIVRQKGKDTHTQQI